jgi:hypothetical protein
MHPHSVMRVLRARFVTVACSTPMLLCAGTLRAEPAPAQTSIQMDNDLFSIRHSDCDYSFGAALTVAAPQWDTLARPVDSLRQRLDDLLPTSVADGSLAWRSAQVGVLGMTPLDLKTSLAQANDRPYASLVSVATSQIELSEDAQRASYSSFTIAALGLGVAEVLQKGVHQIEGGADPRGWNHQVSAGGEPTARFVRAEQWLLGSAEPVARNQREMKFTLAGSAGYLTEASAALSMRFGRIQSAWWQFAPELSDYLAAPVAPASVGWLPERYVFAGARLKARGYDALLQGQFRHSDVRIASDDLERLQAEAWAGIASTWSGWRISYTLRVASREVSNGPAARTLVWAGVNVDRAF